MSSAIKHRTVYAMAIVGPVCPTYLKPNGNIKENNLITLLIPPQYVVHKSTLDTLETGRLMIA
jgi:hypothetical protein